MQTEDGPKQYGAMSLEKACNLIDRLQREIGNGCLVELASRENSLRLRVYWPGENIRYQYKLAIDELTQFKYQDGAEEAFIHYFVALVKREYLQYKEKHNES